MQEVDEMNSDSSIRRMHTAGNGMRGQAVVILPVCTKLIHQKFCKCGNYLRF